MSFMRFFSAILLRFLTVALTFGFHESLWADEVGRVAPYNPLVVPEKDAPVAAVVFEAGSPDGQPSLTRNGALQRALECNPTILQARETLEQKTGYMWQVRAQLLPTVTAFANRTSRDHSLIDRSVAQDNLPEELRSPVATQAFSFGVEVRQLVFDGFGTLNSYWRSDYLMDSSYWQLIAAGYSTITQLQQAYDFVLLKEVNLAIYHETVKEYRKLAEITDKREKAGQITSLDSLRVQTELLRVQSQEAAAHSELAAAVERLNVLLQLPQLNDNYAQPISLEGPLERRIFTMPRDEALCRAGKIHPSIYAAELNCSAAKSGLRAAQATYMPKVEAFARYSSNTSYESFDRDLDGWTLGLSGSWLIFDSLGREGLVRSQYADLMTAEIDLSNQRYTLMSRVRELFAQRDAFEAALIAQEQALFVAERAVVEGRKRYAVGEAEIETVIDAQKAFQDTMLEFKQLVFNYNSAIYQLEYVVSLEPVTPMQIACGI